MAQASISNSPGDRPTCGITDALFSLIREITGACFPFLHLQDAAGDAPDSPAAPSELEIQSEILKLRRLVREALGNGVAEELIGMVGWLAANGRRIELTVVAWVDLIESLVQDTESRYGSQSGLGSLKKAETIQVLSTLFERERRRNPGIPGYVASIMLGLADWIIDAVVLLTNQHDAWEAVPAGSQPMAAIGTRVRENMLKLLPLFRLGILWITGRIETWLLSGVVLSAQTQTAIDRVVNETRSDDVKSAVDNVVKLIEWLGTHGSQVVAVVQLVFAAVQDAERYLELPGPQKKTFAKNLVFAVLDDLGFQERTGLIFAFLDSTISAGIESTVNLLNKRGIFVHRGSAVA